MNHFENHDVMHLSASTINLFIEQPARCLMKIAGKLDGGVGASAWRGTAVDKTITRWMQNPDLKLDDLTSEAQRLFDLESKQSKNEQPEAKLKKERGDLEAFIKSAKEYYTELSEPYESAQGKVTVMLPDIPVPIIGYYDLRLGEKVRDMKTGNAVSKLSFAHARQGSIYGHALKRVPVIDYISKKGVTSFEIQNVNYHIHQFTIAAKALERILSYSNDIIECCQLVYPDLDHWKWSDNEREIAKTLWSMEATND
jgi:hypothetical protein